MKRKRKILDLPFLKGISTEENSHLSIGDGKNVSLINCRPYKRQIVKRYGDRLLGNKLASVSPLGLFYHELGSSINLYMPTNDASGNLYALASPFTGSWTSIGSGFSPAATSWQSTKFLNSVDNTTYAVFTNEIDDIQFVDASGTITTLSKLSAISDTLGDTTSTITVSDASGNTWYTWTGVGTSPVMGTGYQKVGDAFTISGFTGGYTGNNITGAYITAVGTNAIAVVNAAHVNVASQSGLSIQVGKSAPHRPTKAACVAEYGGMLLTGNITALKPLTIHGDANAQISSIDLTGITAGTKYYWELDLDHSYSAPIASNVKITEGIFKSDMVISLSGVTTSNLPSGTGYYIMGYVTESGVGVMRFNLYTDSARTNLVATGAGAPSSFHEDWVTIGVQVVSSYTLGAVKFNLSAPIAYTNFSFDNTTRIVVSMNGTTARYTHSTGTNPTFAVAKAGDKFSCTGFAAANNVSGATITAVSSTYIEIINSSGVADTPGAIGMQHGDPVLTGTVDFSGTVGNPTINGTGTILISDMGSPVTSDLLTFNLYSHVAPSTWTLTSTGSYTSVSALSGTSKTVELSGSISGSVDLGVKDIANVTKNLNQYITTDFEVNPMLIRWCKPYDVTKWNQFDYESLPASYGGLRGIIIVAGQAYFLCNNTLHRAILTGDPEFPLRFEYNVSPVGCPNAETAMDYLGRLQFIANDGSWRSFDGFKPEIISYDISSKLATSSPTVCGHNTRKAVFYFNSDASGNKNKIIGAQNALEISADASERSTGQLPPSWENCNFFDETHAHASSILKMASTDGNVYAAVKDASGYCYAVSMNDPAQTSYDLTNTPITFDFETKDFLIGEQTEAHILRMQVFGSSGGSVVTITPSVDGVAMAPVSSALSEFGILLPIESLATSISLHIASPTSVPTTFYINRIEIEVQNPRII